MNNFDTKRAYEITLRDQDPPVVVQNIKAVTTTGETIQLLGKDDKLLYSIPVTSLVGLKRLNAKQLTERKPLRVVGSKRKPNVVLTSDQWLEALKFHELGFTYREIAEAFNVSEPNVYLHLKNLRSIR